MLSCTQKLPVELKIKIQNRWVWGMEVLRGAKRVLLPRPGLVYSFPHCRAAWFLQEYSYLTFMGRKPDRMADLFFFF